MSAEERKRLVRWLYEEVVDTGNLTIELQIAEGRWAVARVTARGTPRGVWPGMRASLKHCERNALTVTAGL